MARDMRFETKHVGAMDFGSYGLGATVNPQANQLQGTNVGINWGVRSLEIGFMGGRWDQGGGAQGKLGAPEREEMIRLANINKVNLTLHAPIKDPSGFNGKYFDESQKMQTMYEFKDTIKFADQIGQSNKQHNLPVTIHCTDGVKGNPDPEHIIYFVDKETKQLGAVGYEENIEYPLDVLKDLDFPIKKLKDRQIA
ncbi:MAG TPA: hypothetical protein ENN30_00085, partial [Candidatus Woesearchaeota archaeon]|nr:hypothetical protein [Candidatus Woesearchaeota archaeon]